MKEWEGRQISRNLSTIIVTWCTGKLTQLRTTSFFLLILFWTVDRSFTACIFDSLKPEGNLVEKTIDYTGYMSDQEVERSKRSASGPFSPIRISASYHNLDIELSDVEIGQLKMMVTAACDLISETLSVRPVPGTLLLDRSASACATTWTWGPNAGKCESLWTGYRGERCLDDFQIPSDHLEGLYVWNATHPEPVTKVPEGQGLADTDFILYLQASSLSQCVGAGPDVIAYGRYCQLDHDQRPIAGYVNVCPSLLRNPDYNQERLTLVILHELLHTLGFSKDLYEKYRPCKLTGSELQCNEHKRSVRAVAGVKRMVTPRVVEHTSQHFNCVTHPSENEFGAMLQTQGDDVGSHWDAAFMYSSLMTPNVGQAGSTVLDPITLALFEDMGWYQVNYQHAQPFTWGKGGGCDFGVYPQCQTQLDYFCHGSDSGCDHLHKSKAVCKTTSHLHGCRVFLPSSQGVCTQTISTDSDTEVYGTHSRCFVANITKTSDFRELQGQCFQHRCINQNTQLEVKVGQEAWALCPTGSTIQVPGYKGHVVCPPASVLCESMSAGVTTSTASTSTSTTTTITTTATRTRPSATTSTAAAPTTPDNSRLSLIELGFAELKSTTLAADKTKTFQQCVIATLHNTTGVSHSRISNGHVLSAQGPYVTFLFDLLPSSSATDGPASWAVITLLNESVQTGNLTVPLHPGGPTYLATSLRLLSKDPSDEEKEKKSQVAVIVPVVVLTLLACVAVLLFLFCVLRRRRPHAHNCLFSHKDANDSSKR